MPPEEELNDLLQLENNVKLSWPSSSLEPSPALSVNTELPLGDKSTPLLVTPLSSRFNLSDTGVAPASSSAVDLAILNGAPVQSKWWKLRNPLKRSKIAHQSSRLEEEVYRLRSSDSPTPIIAIPPERDTVFTLHAWLGEKRESRRRIHFRSNAISSGKFKEIKISIRFSEPKPTAPSPLKNAGRSKISIAKHHPHGTLRLEEIAVEHGTSQELSGEFSAGAMGGSAGGKMSRTDEVHYTTTEGAMVEGITGRKDTEIHWTMTASKIKDGILKGLCEFWVEIENAEDTVNAGFRVVCKMDRGITNLLQPDVEAPNSKTKPKIEHVPTKLTFTSS